MEKILQDQNHDARMLKRARHRERLTGASCAVSKNAGVVALNDRGNQLRAGALVYVLRRNMLVKDAVEEVALLTTTMKDIRLLVFLHTLHVDFVEDEDEFVLRLHHLEVLTGNFLL